MLDLADDEPGDDLRRHDRWCNHGGRSTGRGSRRAGQRRYPGGMTLPGRPDSEEQDNG
jgi:hypothetical protein